MMHMEPVLPIMQSVPLRAITALTRWRTAALPTKVAWSGVAYMSSYGSRGFYAQQAAGHMTQAFSRPMHFFEWGSAGEPLPRPLPLAAVPRGSASLK